MAMNEGKELMLALARKEKKHIDAEQGYLCCTCAEFSCLEYEWLGLVEGASCYNCGK